VLPFQEPEIAPETGLCKYHDLIIRRSNIKASEGSLELNKKMFW
jgi:hypothetical protein